MSQRTVFVLAIFMASTYAGLDYHPKPPSNLRSDLIWYNRSRAADTKWKTEYWTNELDSFLEGYRNPKNNGNIHTCSFGHPAPDGKVCNVDPTRWAPCVGENQYSYHRGSPCIFLKLNELFNWQPVFYNTSENLPGEMPLDLKDSITYMAAQNISEVNTLWVSCEGETPVDVENIGPIQYIPARGFPGYYFPLRNLDGYRSPLVAIHFERPMIGIVISVNCKIWAQNIVRDGLEEQSSVHFELLID